ncbi:MAG: hydroxysqualene dehydroxylase HpnE, partial [Acidobacteria bacterium]|nr:hydroxysqualene dehydroxylase HpnE [Acidobacteriota bacterium]
MRGSTRGAPDAIVVGGGVAGLAAATAVAESGGRVLLLEARPYLGGRARSWLDPETGVVIDNGQHLMMGCYAEMRRVLDRIGAADGVDWQERLEVPFVDRGGRDSTFRLPALRAPLDVLCGLLRFPGLSLGTRLSFLRVGRELRRLARRNREEVMASLDGQTVAGWLASLGQSSEANERLWHPLSIATLNESPDRASAAMLLSVLRDGLFAGGIGSRLGLARVGLSELFADPAARYLRGRGCEVRTHAPVRRILVDGSGCTGVLMADGERREAGAVVAAVTPDVLLELLPDGAAAEPFFAGVGRLETSPIVSVYLWFGAPVSEMPFAGLIGGTWHWMFNRHALSAAGEGAHAITLVKSAARDFVDR